MSVVEMSENDGPIVKAYMEPKTKEKEIPISLRCVFCNSSSSSDIECGELFLYEPKKGAQKVTSQIQMAFADKNIDGILVAHTFCLLFSKGLKHQHEDKIGIIGFTPKDINNEIVRGKKIKCSFCYKNGATLGCDEMGCDAKFHFPCGKSRGVFYEYFDRFRSFCPSHEPVKSPRPKNPRRMGSFIGVCRSRCTICLHCTPSRASRTVVYSSCCNSYYHYYCIQKYSVEAASYHVRCPNCKNDEIFHAALKHAGVYIPIRDATWETTDDYRRHFAAHCVRPSVCSATDCVCRQGRNFQGRKGGTLELIYCHDCGSEAAHRDCAQSEISRKNAHWLCSNCRSSRETNKNVYLKKAKLDVTSALPRICVENVTCDSIEPDFDKAAKSSGSSIFCVNAVKIIQNSNMNKNSHSNYDESIEVLTDENTSTFNSNPVHCMRLEESMPSTSSFRTNVIDFGSVMKCPKQNSRLYPNSDSDIVTVNPRTIDTDSNLDPDITIIYDGSKRLMEN